MLCWLTAIRVDGRKAARHALRIRRAEDCGVCEARRLLVLTRREVCTAGEVSGEMSCTTVGQRGYGTGNKGYVPSIRPGPRRRCEGQHMVVGCLSGVLDYWWAFNAYWQRLKHSGGRCVGFPHGHVLTRKDCVRQWAWAAPKKTAQQGSTALLGPENLGPQGPFGRRPGGGGYGQPERKSPARKSPARSAGFGHHQAQARKGCEPVSVQPERSGLARSLRFWHGTVRQACSGVLPAAL